MNLFLAEHIDEQSGYLGAEESHHAFRVLRSQPGDRIYVTTGEGKIYQVLVTSINKKQLDFDIEEIYLEEPSERRLTIAIAPTKSNDRFEGFLEKATELGVSRIVPIICKNSERKVYKTERGRKLIQSAAKQSLSCWWPHLDDATTFTKLLNNFADAQIPRFIAYCGDVERLPLLPRLSALNQALVLIGPEGDFTPPEVALAQTHGFIPVNLGAKRLRTETAGMAVALAFNIEV